MDIRYTALYGNVLYGTGGAAQQLLGGRDAAFVYVIGERLTDFFFEKRRQVTGGQEQFACKAFQAEIAV